MKFYLSACLLLAQLLLIQVAQAGVTGNMVVQWNQNLLQLVRTKGVQPATVHGTRNFAMMHIAIDEAVNAIQPNHVSYYSALLSAPSTASVPAAAASAAYNTLLVLYPAQKSQLDLWYANALATVADGTDKDAGVNVGFQSAATIVALRQNDGSAVTLPFYTPGLQPGAYQLTPPNFSQPVFTHWANVQPFALASSNQYRPKAIPAVDSIVFQNSLQQIQDIGFINSTNRTAEQTTIARFWGGQVQNFWNEIAQATVVSQNLNIEQNAHLFALLNIALADATIALYDAKYHFNFWRPITPIQLLNPTWKPLLNTPLDPSYPGAHSALSAAAAIVLSVELQNNNIPFTISSEALSGVNRSFNNFSDAVIEAGLSRTYAGVHYSIDDKSGQLLGREVGLYVLRTPQARKISGLWDKTDR